MTVVAEGLISGPHPRRGKGKPPLPAGGIWPGEHRGHLIREGGVDNPEYVNIPENLISETPGSNLRLKKAIDLKASVVAAENPDSIVRFRSEPLRRAGKTRPFAVTHSILLDGEIIETVTILNR